MSSWKTPIPPCTTVFSLGLSVPYSSQQSLFLPPHLTNHWSWGRLFWFRPGAGTFPNGDRNICISHNITKHSCHIQNHLKRPDAVIIHFFVRSKWCYSNSCHMWNQQRCQDSEMLYRFCFRQMASVTALTALSSSSLAPPTSQPFFTMSYLSSTLLLW